MKQVERWKLTKFDAVFEIGFICPKYTDIMLLIIILQEQNIILHERELVLQEREQTLKEQLEASFAEQDKVNQNARREMMRRFVVLQEVL